MNASEIAQSCAEKMWGQDACSNALGMQIESIAPGSATLSMTVRADMLNGQKICHGGILFTLADSTFAFACNTYNQYAVAQHCHISFLMPVYENERLQAVASERHRVKRSGIYDVVISREDGEIVAEFRGFSRTLAGQHLSNPTTDDQSE